MSPRPRDGAARALAGTPFQAVLAALAIGIVGAVSIGSGQLLLVPSLGAAILLQVHFPDLPSARPWNSAVGQAYGAVCGFGAVYALGVATGAGFTNGQTLLVARVAAGALAVAVTLLLQVALHAATPAGGATALILALDSETADAAGLARLTAAIILLAALGEVARWVALRLKR